VIIVAIVAATISATVAIKEALAMQLAKGAHNVHVHIRLDYGVLD